MEDEYEYCVKLESEKPMGASGVRVRNSIWVSREIAESRLKSDGLQGEDFVIGKWTRRIVKRRKAGPEEEL